MLCLISQLGLSTVAGKTIAQQTQGDCSPAIIAQGNVSVNCGISKKLLKRLQAEVIKKNAKQDFKIESQGDKLESLIKDYQQLKESLTERDDKTAKQAQEKLADGDFEGAEALFQQSYAQHSEGAEKQEKAQAADAFALAEINRLQFKYPEAKIYYQKAVQLDPENPLYLHRAGLTRYTLGEYDEAELLYLHSLRIRENELEKNHPDVASSLNNLALLYDAQNKFAQAEPLHFRSLAIREILGKDHPDVAISLDSMGAHYYAQGQYNKAEPLQIRSLAIREKAGKNHSDSDVAISLYALAYTYSEMGKYQQAESYFSRSLTILEKNYGKYNLLLTNSLSGLAHLYFVQSKFAEAEPLFLRSLAINEKAFGKNHPQVALCLNSLADVYSAQEKYDIAKPLYLRSLAIFEKTFNKDHASVSTSLQGLAQLYVAQGKLAEAEPLFLRSLAINEKAFGNFDTNVASNLNGLAGLYAEQGYYDKAEPLYLRSLEIFENVLGEDHPYSKSVRSNFLQFQAILHK
jgi:tetratricopeptide (TPR) repeat protein